MSVANRATDVTKYFVLRDSTTHLPKTGVTITDIDVYYVEYRSAISSKADLTALAAAASAHSDNKGFEIGQGVYRIDWPDAAFDGGVGTHVVLIVVCAGVDTVFMDVDLYDPLSYTSGTVHADAGNSATSFQTHLAQADNYWNDAIILFTSGALAGQSKKIGDFANTGGVITLAGTETFTATPSDNDEFVILNR